MLTAWGSEKMVKWRAGMQENKLSKMVTVTQPNYTFFKFLNLYSQPQLLHDFFCCFSVKSHQMLTFYWYLCIYSIPGVTLSYSSISLQNPFRNTTAAKMGSFRILIISSFFFDLWDKDLASFRNCSKWSLQLEK